MNALANTSPPRKLSFLKRTLSRFLVLVAGAGFLVSCHSRAKNVESVEVEVRQVGFDHLSNSPVVLLQDKEKTKTMPIWIGVAEAQSITLQMQGVDTPRPLTHDLMKNILEQTGITVDKVLVTELKGSTYYARIHLHHGDKTLEVDSRPSDAIALALRLHRPIFVAGPLFAAALSSEGTGQKTAGKNVPSPASTVIFGLTVQDLTAALAAHFDLPDGEGVLIADIGSALDLGTLKRGDIILSVQGEKIRNVNELRESLEKEGNRSVTLRVRREGQDIEVRFALAREESTKTEEENE
ncbi:MAG: bifunctional nuclease family protein [Deltaproteobacteria bacterium]|nr:bifunctional nuclease family protein [Deltaproteobacteria bacterium]